MRAGRRLPPLRRVAAFGAALCLAGCGLPQLTPAPAPKAKAPAAPEPPVPAAAEPEPEVPKSPSARKARLRPMKVRPLTVQANCSFKDEAGYSASTRLDVSYAEVLDFAATVDIPRRGSCRFNLADFRQVRREPHVELQGADGCTVHLWEQGDQVTVAFSECAQRCTSGAFDYVWPILLDRSNGQCK